MNKRKKLIKILKTLKKFYKIKSYLAKQKKDPFQILIKTILSQRTKDKTTEIIGKKLFEKYRNIKELAKAKTKDIEKTIKGVGFYRQKAKRIKEIANTILRKYNGSVPANEEELLKFKGVGHKTAACVLSYGFGKESIAVDTHVHRIINRIGILKTKNAKETQKELMRILPKNYWSLVNEVFVVHGQQTCKPLKPKCKSCPIVKYCKFAKLEILTRNTK